MPMSAGPHTLVAMPTEDPLEHVYSIIPAGGVGSRLWPLSRSQEPKFLLDLTRAGHSLLQATWERLQPLTGPNRTYVVTGYSHSHAVQRQLPELPRENILLEPQPRDSAAAIGMATAIIRKRDPQAIVCSFAADHHITNAEEFRAVVRRAISGAAAGYIATIGITPTEPSAAFGYIHTDGPVDEGRLPGVLQVEAFVEKPSRERAAEFLAEGGYFWNAGMFIAKADVLLERLGASEPELTRDLLAIADVWDTPEGYRVKERVWDQLKKVAIDYAVAEPAAAAGQVVTVRGDFGWDDVGDFPAIARHLISGSAGQLAILGDGAQVISDASSGLVVGESKRLVAVLGMEDVIVVDTDDVLLVTTRDSAQRVKTMVERLRLAGKSEIL